MASSPSCFLRPPRRPNGASATRGPEIRSRTLLVSSPEHIGQTMYTEDATMRSKTAILTMLALAAAAAPAVAQGAAHGHAMGGGAMATPGTVMVGGSAMLPTRDIVDNAV